VQERIIVIGGKRIDPEGNKAQVSNDPFSFLLFILKGKEGKGRLIFF
jgi:hypothetical protein